MLLLFLVHACAYLKTHICISAGVHVYVLSCDHSKQLREAPVFGWSYTLIHKLLTHSPVVGLEVWWGLG